MEALSAEAFASVLALVGLVIVIAALLSGYIERSNFPQVAVFLGLGAVLGPHGLGLLNVGLDSPILRVVATLSLALVLFTDAVSLSIKEIRQNSGLAMLVLGPGTLSSAALVSFAAWWLLGLPPAAAIVLGAALASTDPVLLRGLLRRPDMPRTARLALQLESGLNDVVLLPVVLVAMQFLGPAGGHAVPWAKLAIDLFLLGPAAGVLVGLLSVATLDLVRRRVGVRRDYESIYSLGVAFAAFAAAEAVHGSGFLAAFMAGMTIAALDVELCDCFLEYGETTAEMALLFTFVLLGASLIWTGFGMLSFAAAVSAALVILVRPLTFLASLAPTKLDRKSKGLIAWFGPRGLSSLLLVLLPVFAGVPGSDRVFSLCCLVVVFSVTVHGGSLMALGNRKDRQRAAGTLPPPQRAETAGEAAPEAGDAPPATPVAAPHVPGPAPAPRPAPRRPLPVAPAGQDGADGREPVAVGGDTSAPPALPDDDGEFMTIAQMRRLQERGAPVVVVDARSHRTFDASDALAAGSVRLDPDRASREARRLGLPRDAWLPTFCT